MKKKVELIHIFLITFLLISCHTSQMVSDVKLVESQILYQQAIKALENQQFVIQASELYPFRKKKTVITTPGSYISMNNYQAVIYFTPDVFPGDPWTYLSIKDDASKMTTIKEKKNGDRQYIIKVNSDREWLRREVLITLYKNTNKCFVQVKDRAGSSVIDFKGELYPREE